MPNTMNPVSFDPRDSSMIKRISHRPDTNTLIVHFKNGSVYAYEGVSHSRYAELQSVEDAGDSVGSHFIKTIKNGGFLFRKVEMAGA